MRIALQVALGLALGLTLATTVRAAGDNDSTWPRFRDTYRELIETDTTLSAGDCTLAARRMGKRLLDAGYPQADVRVFVPDGHPKEGGLLAILRGSDPAASAVLLLAHIDVVEAHREDWTRDPFTLVEEDGYFYGRGTVDMKAQAAVWVDSLVRFREQGWQPKRTLKLALTCGEETGTALDGAQWLVEHDLPSVAAGIAVTEGIDGMLDEHGHRVALGVQAAEKFYKDFTLEVTNSGGHSSRPRPDNAIYSLVRALARISAHEFPVQFVDANRLYFTRMATITGGAQGAAMAAIVRNPRDAKAARLLDGDPNLHAMLRTTCVATLLSAGHAPNALPQRATANVNCRIIPGVASAEVQHVLEQLVHDPAVKIVPVGEHDLPAPAMALTPAVLGPIEAVSAELWPGVPVVPALEPGGSDAVYTAPAGIPTIGVTGLFTDPDGGRMHGLNERLRVQSLVEGREFLYRLVKRYAEQ
jgi:acetylornithine deacetylase/succinyl-diaminopimelate desuccinylase-like protein